MKVMHIEGGKHLYGGARQVLYIMEGLSAQGVENLLVCPLGSAISQQAGASAQVLRLKWQHELDLGLIFRIRALIKIHKPDVVHLHSRRGADSMGLIAAMLSGTPVVLSRRVDNPEGKLAMSLKYPLVDRVIAISAGIGRVLLSQGLNTKKLRVIPSAVDPRPYQTHATRSDFMQTFELPEDALTIGVVAQLIERKGHRFLLEVLPELKSKHPNLQVLIFGQGPLQSALERQTQDLGYVTLCGFRDDLTRWMGCLDIVAHPAETEGLGVSLLQAASAGVAICASNVGGIPEIVIDRQTGLLVEPGQTEELKKALDELLSSKPLRYELGSSAQAHVMRHFSIDRMVDGNLAVYRELTSAAP